MKLKQLHLFVYANSFSAVILLYTALKMKFSIKDFFSKTNLQETMDLVTYTEEILNGKLHFLCSVSIICELDLSLQNDLKYKIAANSSGVLMWFSNSEEYQLPLASVSPSHYIPLCWHLSKLCNIPVEYLLGIFKFSFNLLGYWVL